MTYCVYLLLATCKSLPVGDLQSICKSWNCCASGLDQASTYPYRPLPICMRSPETTRNILCSG